MEQGISKNQMLTELSRSPHGKLSEYIPVGQKAARTEPEFLAHLIAWDNKNGQIRDAKAALPMVSLSVPSFPDELAQNSLAHLALLNPREFLKAYRFGRNELKLTRAVLRHKLDPTVERYLRETEEVWGIWQRVAVQHKNTLKELYSLAHIKPGNDRINAVLFGRHLDKSKAGLPKGSIFEVITKLKDMSPTEAAGTILEWKIPFLIVRGALGKGIKDSALVLALIRSMSPSELVNNTKILQKLGMNDNPALKGAYEEGLKKVQTSKKNVLKATKAAEAVTDESLKAKLRGVQDKQLESMKVEGDWLVLGDKSGSMSHAIETARQVAAVLAKMVKGKVWLVFFDTQPQTIDVSGMPLDVINNVTKYVRAGGGTSIGCGLQRMLDNNTEVDGIAIVSDAGENTAPTFPDVYTRYCKKFGKEIPVYLYQCTGDSPALISSMECNKIDMQVFDIRGGVDYYSLPNLVATMRTNRYSLIDEVMATPLLTLNEAFKQKSKRKEVAYAIAV